MVSTGRNLLYLLPNVPPSLPPSTLTCCEQSEFQLQGHTQVPTCPRGLELRLPPQSCFQLGLPVLLNSCYYLILTGHINGLRVLSRHHETTLQREDIIQKEREVIPALSLAGQKQGPKGSIPGTVGPRSSGDSSVYSG